MIKGGQKRQSRAAERLAGDAVGAQVSGRAQMRVAGAPHHGLAPPGGRCQSHLVRHLRGRRWGDTRKLSEMMRWDGHALGLRCLPWELNALFSISTIPPLTSSPIAHRGIGMS